MHSFNFKSTTFCAGTVASMISSLNSGSSSLGDKPWLGQVVSCSWERHFALTVPPCCQVYKRIPVGELNTGGRGQPCDGLPSHPGGRKNTASHFTLQPVETGDKRQPDGPLGWCANYITIILYYTILYTKN